jgi:hypothetical protein
MGGVFNVVNLHLYHYAGNNPVKYVDPDGRVSGFVTDSDSVPVVGHSAMYVEIYDKAGASIGFELYEVGATNHKDVGKININDKTGSNSETLSSDMIDLSMALAGSAASGSSAGSASAATTVGAGSAGLQAGVKREFFPTRQALDARLSRYDKVVEFNTTQTQDKAIQQAATQRGTGFGRYNPLLNNCSQYASAVLAAGGVRTTQWPIPNRAHNYILRIIRSLL